MEHPRPREPFLPSEYVPAAPPTDKPLDLRHIDASTVTPASEGFTEAKRLALPRAALSPTDGDPPEADQGGAGEDETEYCPDPIKTDDERKVRFRDYSVQAALAGLAISEIAQRTTPETEERDNLFQSLPGYVAHSAAETVVLWTADGRLLKVNPDNTSDDIREYAESRRRAEGSADLEQLYACSDTPGTLGVVVEPVLGVKIGDLLPQERDSISDELLEAFCETLIEMQSKRLCPDLNHPDNVIFSGDRFVIIDYQTHELALDEGTLLEELNAGWDAATFCNNVLLFDHQKGQPLPDIAIRFYRACERRFPPEVMESLRREWANDGRPLPD